MSFTHSFKRSLHILLPLLLFLLSPSIEKPNGIRAEENQPGIKQPGPMDAAALQPKSTYRLVQANAKRKDLILENLGNGWVKAGGSSYIQNITPEEAREKAVAQASRRAIEFFAGTQVQHRFLAVETGDKDDVTMQHFSVLTNITSGGVILKREILDEAVESEGSILKKVVVLKVKISKQKGERDPYFTVEGEINKEHFYDGEELELTLKSTRDCFITILNICSDNNVYIIFPNQYRKDNFIRGYKIQ